MAVWIPQMLWHRTLSSCYNRKMVKMFGQRDYKYGYIEKSFKSLWLHFTWPFNSETCCLRFWLQHRCFPVNIATFLGTIILKNICKRLLLKFIRIIESFISNRQQRTKINHAFSRFSEILFRVPQGSILGPLLFSVYICDIFFYIIECDIASYADDTILKNLLTLY